MNQDSADVKYALVIAIARIGVKDYKSNTQQGAKGQQCQSCKLNVLFVSKNNPDQRQCE